MLERTNCAFAKVEVLSRNIGYLKFNAFADPTFCGPTVVAAMNFLAHLDAIIFDLRENGGETRRWSRQCLAGPHPSIVDAIPSRELAQSGKSYREVLEGNSISDFP